MAIGQLVVLHRRLKKDRIAHCAVLCSLLTCPAGPGSEIQKGLRPGNSAIIMYQAIFRLLILENQVGIQIIKPTKIGIVNVLGYQAQ